MNWGHELYPLEGVQMKAKNFCDLRIRRWQGFFDPFILQACIEFISKDRLINFK